VPKSRRKSYLLENDRAFFAIRELAFLIAQRICVGLTDIGLDRWNVADLVGKHALGHHIRHDDPIRCRPVTSGDFVFPALMKPKRAPAVMSLRSAVPCKS